MENFIITITVLCCFLVVYFSTKYNAKLIKLLTSFSGGFLLAFMVSSFLPGIYAQADVKFISLCILIGYLFQLMLDYFSQGIEHGHMHSKEKTKNYFPWAVYLSLTIHSIIEGMPLFESHGHNHNEDYFLAVLLHKIPVVVVLSTMLISRVKVKWVVIVAILLFSVSTFIGTLLTGFFFQSFNVIIMPYLQAIMAGVFLHISTTILYESSENHKFNFIKLVIILLGFVLGFIHTL